MVTSKNALRGIFRDGNEKSHFFVSVSKNATEGIFRGYHKYLTIFQS